MRERSVSAFRARPRMLLPALLLALIVPAAQAQVTVVNMIPNSLSGETHQDSEPNLAVNTANPQQIAGSAFTPNPAGGANAPIYVSTDGGNTWALNSIVPGNGLHGTGDITVQFGGTSNRLYSGILRGDFGGPGTRVNILSTNNFTQPNTMTILVDRNGPDQPFVQATTVLGGAGVGSDRVYVGNNDLAAAAGKTATVDTSLDGTSFNSRVIEKRTTAAQDGPQVRPAWHYDGTVYSIFYRWTNIAGTVTSADITADVVVVRDNFWAAGANPYTALVDPGDSVAGRKVVSGVTVLWRNFGFLGQERVGGSLSIAVDPRNSSRVYIAWADTPAGTTTYRLHVRRSDNAGATWSADLFTVDNAINPSLAVNTHGKVGFLYQQHTAAGRWETHLRRSSDLGATWNDMTLSTTPSNAPAPQFRPYIGDYADLQAVGKDFYGVFSANNTPNLANFPQGVTYQRNANFNTQQLLATNGTTVVAISIDPFFFKITELSPSLDFYVRDWTDNPASGDTGLEPSTHPIFYTTSDVWNRRGTLPGPFPNDQPSSEPAGNGAGIVGDNWAFARIRRNAPGSASQTVTAHFLVSKFGTGSNYVDWSSGDPDVFMSPPPDPTVTFAAAALGPIITPPYYWHLNAVASSHLCLAVEISTASDPFVAPSLRGFAPGWPVTDLRVLLDNNKAQRNLGLSTTPARGIGGFVDLYGIAHNAALRPRDMILRYSVDSHDLVRLSGGRVKIAGQGEMPLSESGEIRIPDVMPGENRWVGVSLPAASGSDGEILKVDFHEIVQDQVIDGFSIGTRLSLAEKVFADAVERHRSVYTRLAAGYGIADAAAEASAAEALLQQGTLSADVYAQFLADRFPTMNSAFQQFLALSSGDDPFGAGQEIERLGARIAAGDDAESQAVPHVSFLNLLDSLVTRHRLARGDVADILQNVRWQRELLVRVESLAALSAAGAIVEASRDWIQSYQEGAVDNSGYPAFLTGILGDLYSAAGELEGRLPGITGNVKAIEDNLGDLVALQKAHRDFLLRLQSLESPGSGGSTGSP